MKALWSSAPVDRLIEAHKARMLAKPAPVVYINRPASVGSAGPTALAWVNCSFPEPSTATFTARRSAQSVNASEPIGGELAIEYIAGNEGVQVAPTPPPSKMRPSSLLTRVSLFEVLCNVFHKCELDARVRCEMVEKPF